MPLTNIKLYTQMLQSGRRPEKADHYLRVLAEQVGALEHLVQDSLEMTLLDSGRSVTTWEPLRLPEMIQDAVTRFQDQALAADLVLDARPIPDELPAVQGDQTRLNQALAEVVENAIIFTSMRNQDEMPALAQDRESRRVSIETGTIDDGEQIWVTIAVRDTGPGILPKEQERVFDRFFRGNLAESGHIVGAGLGLSIAQAIVQAHGGRVTMESEPGSGSTFTLWLRGSPAQQDMAQRVG
jgi:signal transduction histidine kinase